MSKYFGIPGNIDLYSRPHVRNADGSISTVRSMSFEAPDGSEVLVPTVGDEGRILSDEEAIDRYMRTGNHLGVFRSPDDATRYAQRLHEEFAAGKYDRHQLGEPMPSYFGTGRQYGGGFGMPQKYEPKQPNAQTQKGQVAEYAFPEPGMGDPDDEHLTPLLKRLQDLDNTSKDTNVATELAIFFGTVAKDPEVLQIALGNRERRYQEAAQIHSQISQDRAARALARQQLAELAEKRQKQQFDLRSLAVREGENYLGGPSAVEDYLTGGPAPGLPDPLELERGKLRLRSEFDLDRFMKEQEIRNEQEKYMEGVRHTHNMDRDRARNADIVQRLSMPKPPPAQRVRVTTYDDIRKLLDDGSKEKSFDELRASGPEGALEAADIANNILANIEDGTIEAPESVVNMLKTTIQNLMIIANK